MAAVDTRRNPVPVRAYAAAYAIPLCLLPSVLWRVHLIAYPGGWYPVALSGAELALGLSGLVLVHRWGEEVPGRVPLVGGRRIPVPLVAVPAGLGAAAVTLLTAYWLLNTVFGFVTPEQARAISPDIAGSGGTFDAEAPGGWVLAAYLPMLLWGPLLAALTVAYVRRRVSPV
ncbi:hypothetical protein [Nocardiopsis halophila]|uniref:hypothetical protein n=1 Tax=Nocardiopsis halophila TaxID=141692 RepID=UPI0003461CB1